MAGANRKRCRLSRLAACTPASHCKKRLLRAVGKRGASRYEVVENHPASPSEEIEEPTIVVSSGEDDDHHHSSYPVQSLSRAMGATGLHHEADRSTSQISLAVHAIRVWISLAQESMERGQSVGYQHSSKAVDCVRRLYKVAAPDSSYLQPLDAEVLHRVLPLVEGFVAFSRTVRVSPEASLTVRSSGAERERKRRELEYRLHASLAVLGCLELITCVAALPGSSIIPVYNGTDKFLCELCNFVRTGCLEAMDLYTRFLKKTTVQPQAKRRVTKKTVFENVVSRVTIAPNDWKVSLIVSATRIVVDLHRMVAAYQLPDTVLHCIISLLRTCLGFNSSSASTGHLPFHFPSEVLSSFQHSAISCLTELYAQAPSLSSSIESSVVSLVPECVSSKHTGSRIGRLSSVIVALLSLPNAFPGASTTPVSDLRLTLTKTMEDPFTAFKLLGTRAEIVAACVRRISLQLIKTCLLYPQDDTVTMEGVCSRFSTADLREHRECLRRVVTAICKASESPAYPSSVFYLHQLARLCIRLVLLNVRPFDSFESSNSITKAMRSRSATCEKPVVERWSSWATESALLVLGDIAHHVFGLHSLPAVRESAEEIMDGYIAEGGCGICGASDLKASILRCVNCQGVYHTKCTSLEITTADDAARWLCDRCQLRRIAVTVITNSTLRKLEVMQLGEQYFKDAAEGDDVRSLLRSMYHPCAASSSGTDASFQLPWFLACSLPLVSFADTALRPASLTSCHRSITATRPATKQNYLNFLTRQQSLIPHDHPFRTRGTLLTLLALPILSGGPCYDAGCNVLRSLHVPLKEPIFAQDNGRNDRQAKKNGRSNSTQLKLPVSRNAKSFRSQTTLKAKNVIAAVLALEILLTQIPPAAPLERSASDVTMQSTVMDLQPIWSQENTSQLQAHGAMRLWSHCVSETLLPLRPLFIKLILATQKTCWNKIRAASIPLLGVCCTRSPSLLLALSDGPNFLKHIIASCTSPSPRCRKYAISLVGTLWSQIQHSFDDPSFYRRVIADLDTHQRVPLMGGDHSLPPFLTPDTASDVIDRLTQSTSSHNIVLELSLFGNIQKPVSTRDTLITSVRVVEVLLRVCLPLVARALDDTVSEVRLQAANVFKEILPDLPLQVKFLPALASRLFLRLRCADELPSIRSAAAFTFNTMWLDNKRASCQGFYTCNENDTSGKALDLEGFICTLVLLGEVADRKRRGRFCTSLSLDFCWSELNKREFSETVSQKMEERVFSEPEELTKYERSITAFPSNQQAKGKCATDALVASSAHDPQRNVRYIDPQLPVFLQILLYGLAMSMYTTEDIDIMFEGLLSRLLRLFLDLQENFRLAEESHNDNHNNARLLSAVEVIRTVRILAETRPTKISNVFIKHLFPYFQEPADTRSRTALMCELCYVIATATWGRKHDIRRNVYLSDAVASPTSVSVTVSKSTLRDFCSLEDALLQNLVPCNSRSLVAAAVECLCASVCNITNNYAHALEPCLVDCLAILLPFRTAMLLCRGHETQHRADSSGILLLRYGIGLLTRRRTEGGRVLVTIDPNNVTLLRKQLLFVLEGVKRRIWLLGVLCSAINLESDIIYDLENHDSPEVCGESQDKETERLEPKLEHDDFKTDIQSRQSWEIATTPQPRQTTQTLSARSAETIDGSNQEPDPQDINVSAIQQLLDTLSEAAPRSSLVLSRCLRQLLSYLVIETAEFSSLQANSEPLALERSARIAQLMDCLALNFKHEVFFLFIDTYENAEVFEEFATADFPIVTNIRVLILQSLCLFLQQHWTFLTSRRVRLALSAALTKWEVPRLQLTALESIASLLTHYETASHKDGGDTVSGQPLAAHGEEIVDICRGFRLEYRSQNERFSSLVVPGMLEVLSAHGNIEERNAIQLAALNTLSKLNRQGLVNPSFVVEKLLGLLFHLHQSIRSAAWLCLHETFESSSVDILIISRITMLMSHAFLTITLPPLYWEKSSDECGQRPVCSVCRLPDLLRSTSSVELYFFSTLYKGYISHRQSFYERVLSHLANLIHEGPQRFVSKALSYCSLSFSLVTNKECCTSARLLAQVTRRLSLPLTEGFAWIMHLLFIRWITDILACLPYTREREVLYLSDLLVSNLLSTVPAFYGTVESSDPVLRTSSSKLNPLLFPKCSSALNRKQPEPASSTTRYIESCDTDDGPPTCRLSGFLRDTSLSASSYAGKLLAVQVAFSCVMSVALLESLAANYNISRAHYGMCTMDRPLDDPGLFNARLDRSFLHEEVDDQSIAVGLRSLSPTLLSGPMEKMLNELFDTLASDIDLISLMKKLKAIMSILEDNDCIATLKNKLNLQDVSAKTRVKKVAQKQRCRTGSAARVRKRHEIDVSESDASSTTS